MATQMIRQTGRFCDGLLNSLKTICRPFPGTEVVDRFADPGEQVLVEINPKLASELGLDVDEVAKAMIGADAKGAAGLIRSGESDLVIEMANQFEEAGRIGETLIQTGRGGEVVRLADIATIRRGVPDPLPTFADIDGAPAVSLGVLVRPNQRLDLWRPKAQEVLDRFAGTLPEGITIDLPLDQSKYVDDRLSSLALNLVIGAFAVVMVVLFLMGWRSALVVAMSLPLSALSVLFGLRLMDVPIHQMSVTGMIIALGLLIDNAIVAVDEVTASIRRGRSRMDAVRDMVGHLAVPLAGSTATTAIAFAPIAMMPGNAGEFVGAISISVIIAITASLFFALTVIPVAAAKFVRPTNDSAKRSRLRSLVENGFSSDRMVAAFRKLLTWILVRPIRGVVAGLALPIFGFIVASQLPRTVLSTGGS